MGKNAIAVDLFVSIALRIDDPSARWFRPTDDLFINGTGKCGV
jgi:hypothetical protein